LNGDLFSEKQLNAIRFSTVNNTMSRVCSTGESGEITLSEEVVKDLNIYSFHFMMKTVEAKCKGTLKVCQIKNEMQKLWP